MRVTEREDDLLALHVGLVTDADDVHLFAEPFGHADDRVVCQRAGEPVQGGLLVGTALGAQLFAFDLETYPLRNRSLESAFRTLNFELLLMDSDGDALRHRDHFFSYP